MVAENFNIVKDDFMLSLADGYDLESNAAEYIIAWESLKKAPTDDMLRTLKYTAETIMKDKEQMEASGVDAVQASQEGPGYLLAREEIYGEPTNHIWADGLKGAKHIGVSHSVWPRFEGKPGSKYTNAHFPFHSSIHPLLRKNSVTQTPAFVEKFRRHIFDGHAVEEGRMEGLLHDELEKVKSPLIFGHKGKTILGPIRVNGSNISHQHDLYQRDFNRWKKLNDKKEGEYIKEGYSPEEIQNRLRVDHFEARAKQWTDEGVVADENGDEHGIALGHEAYMYGLEWLNPVERTAVMRRIHEEGGLDKHPLIKLPNGEVIPSARIAWNNLMRRTPELNWATRHGKNGGRRSFHRSENNETDYRQGANRHNQYAFGEAAHSYPLGDEKLSVTPSEVIIDALHDRFGIEEDGEGNWVGKPFSFLPKLNLHKKDIQNTYNQDELWKSSRRHTKSKKVMTGIKETHMPIEDILFLAGYDPKTRKPMLNHPIYGEMDGPLIQLHDLEAMEEDALANSDINSRAKEMREHLAYLQAAFGPHPDEEKSNLWELGGNGNYTVGPGNFWDSVFSQYGGAGMVQSTYNEIMHSMAPHTGLQAKALESLVPASFSANQDEPFNPFTGKGTQILPKPIEEDDSMPEFSSMFQTIAHGNNKYSPFTPNDENLSLGLHFGTGKQRNIGAFNLAKKKFEYFGTRGLLENIFSPTNVFTRTRDGDKHNWTLHKNTIAPETEYRLRTMTPDEKQNVNGLTDYMHHVYSQNAFKTTHPTQAYSAHSGDIPQKEKQRVLHYLKTMLGRSNSPHLPIKQSMHSLKNLKDGKVPVTYGADADDFLDYQNLGQPQPSFKNTKSHIENDNSAKNMRILTAIARLNNNSPQQVHNFLHDIDDDENDIGFQQIKSILEKQKGTLNEGDIEGLHEWLTQHRYDLATEKKKKGAKGSLAGKSKVPTMQDKLDDEGKVMFDDSGIKMKEMIPFDAHTIHRALSMGGMMPSVQREEEIRDELDQLNSMLYDPASQGEFTLEYAESIRNQMRQLTAELNKIQNKAIRGASGKGNPVDYNAKLLNKLITSSREATFKAAQFLLPRVLEHDPNHFSKELAMTNPQQFLANHNRLMYDAERMLNTVPHEVHGITAPTVRFGMQSQKVPARQKGVHPSITEHLRGEDVFSVDGTMNTDEVLEGLGLVPKTTEQRNRMALHVQRLIDESNNTNQPLKVSTLGKLMESGKFDNEFNLHHLGGDDEFLQDAIENGFHTAMDNAQPNRPKWKQHPIHPIVQSIRHVLNDEALMTPAGLSFFDAGLKNIKGQTLDIHNRFGTGSGEKKYKTRATKNRLDSIIALNEDAVNEENMEPETKDILTHGFNDEPVPIGGVNPDINGIMNTHTDATVVHSVAQPTQSTFGIEYAQNGQPVVGTHTEPQLYQNTWQDAITGLHGQQLGTTVLDNLQKIPLEDTTSPALAMDPTTYETAEDRIALSEMGDYITSLLNPDVLLTKADDAEWVPPVRPMHRIFDLKDLEHLRGFSGSWVVSKWYDGKRVIIVQNNNEITTYNENGRKVGLKKAFKESLAELNDNNFVIDGIIGEEDLNIIDIINYDDTNVAEMLMHERLKILRGQFDSHENVIIPGPHDTKMTDDEGLEDAVQILQKEHSIVLLRDNKSTYMKGERRHPKWLLLRKTRDFNFIVLDRRGKGPYSYQLGAGPILDGDSLGNRAIEYKNDTYMDVGTAHNQQKLFKVGDIIRATVTGVTKKRRKSRDVFNVQVGEIESEGEGEGAASAESLDLMTKSFAPILIPHDIEYNNGVVQVILKNVDTVSYQVDRHNDNWYLHSPTSTIGGLQKSNYPITLAESLHPFWHSVAPLMLEGHLIKSTMMDEEKTPSRERQDRQSAGVLDEDDENRLLKPSTKKALEVISRALDQLAKEKLTWTGPKGLGIDMATPIESPSGPTKLTEESNLPDYDGKKRPEEEERKPHSGGKEKKTITHVEMKTDADESIVFDDEDGTPTLSV